MSPQKKTFDKQLYLKVSIPDLILFTLFSMEGKKQKPNFERLVKECFNFFPDVFGFSDFSKWPDSRKLDRPLRSLRKKALVSGGPKTFFCLTGKGKKKAQSIGKVFLQRKLFK